MCTKVVLLTTVRGWISPIISQALSHSRQVTEAFTVYFKPPCQPALAPPPGLWNGLIWDPLLSESPQQCTLQTSGNLQCPCCPSSNLSPSVTSLPPDPGSSPVSLCQHPWLAHTCFSLLTETRHCPFPACHIHKPCRPCLSLTPLSSREQNRMGCDSSYGMAPADRTGNLRFLQVSHLPGLIHHSSINFHVYHFQSRHKAIFFCSLRSK